jgi:hypothetical protein
MVSEHIFPLYRFKLLLRATHRTRLTKEILNTLNQALGSGAFMQQVEAMLARQTEEQPKGRPRKDNGSLEY